MSNYFGLGPLVVDVASVVASAFLLKWVWALRRPQADKLMSRQLWHLALADVIDSLMSVPWWALEFLSSFIGLGNSSMALDLLCSVSMWTCTAFMTSMLVEVHVALATVFALYRCPTALRILSRSLPLVWPAGFVLGALEASLSAATWDNSEQKCNFEGQAQWALKGEFIESIVLTVAFVICSATYAVGIVYVARGTGGSVQERLVRRAGIFSLAAVVSWGPYVALTFGTAHGDDLVDVRKHHPLWYYAAHSVMCSNGLLNACAYLWQCRTHRQLRLATGVSLQDLATVSDTSGSGRQLTGSLTVAFSQEDDDVLLVPRSTRNANRTAEREISALHHEQNAAPPSESHSFHEVAHSFQDRHEVRQHRDALFGEALQDTVAGSTADALALGKPALLVEDDDDFLNCFDDVPLPHEMGP